MRISERLFRGRTAGLYCDTGRITNRLKSTVAADGAGGYRVCAGQGRRCSHFV